MLLRRGSLFSNGAGKSVQVQKNKNSSLFPTMFRNQLKIKDLNVKAKYELLQKEKHFKAVEQAMFIDSHKDIGSQGETTKCDYIN